MAARKVEHDGRQGCTMPVTAPADKRLLRAHARPARRHRAWRRWVVPIVRAAFVLGVGGYGGALVAGGIEHSGILEIRRITVAGMERLSAADVAALAGDLRGRNILRADLALCRRRLLDSPWIGAAVLRRRLPGTIEIVIAERVPMGIARVAGDLYLVDEAGVMMDSYGPRHANLDLPIIDGLAVPGRPTDPRRLALAVRLLDAVAARADLASQISQFDVSDPANAVVILENDPALLRLGDEAFVERLTAYLEVAPRLREWVSTIDFVDLRFGERVVVGTAGRSVLARRAVRQQ